MTLSPGTVAIFRDLPRKRARKRENESPTLPPAIGLVVRVAATGLVIRLRVGLGYAPRPRTCEPANAVRVATGRERETGRVIDPLP